MPSNMRDVFIIQQNNVHIGYTCDDKVTYVPIELEKPDNNDYLTDEESDEAIDFEVKVPGLGELITQFENEDEIIIKETTQKKEFAKNELASGFELEPRVDIIDRKGENSSLLDKNMGLQRQWHQNAMSGYISDMNQAVQKKDNKLFLI